MEEMNTTWPRARRSRGNTVRVTASGPTRFTSSWVCIFGPGQRLARAADSDAGVVDQGIEPTRELAVECGQVRGDGDVELDRHDQLGLLGQPLGRDVGPETGVHPPSRTGQAPSDGAADAAAGAGAQNGPRAHGPTLAPIGRGAAGSAVLELCSLRRSGSLT
jgi:hypothetical protein